LVVVIQVALKEEKRTSRAFGTRHVIAAYVAHAGKTIAITHLKEPKCTVRLLSRCE
jgi:DNA integrity scanning protein DisA with diadenylate cyclase activity